MMPRMTFFLLGCQKMRRILFAFASRKRLRNSSINCVTLFGEPLRIIAMANLKAGIAKYLLEWSEMIQNILQLSLQTLVKEFIAYLGQVEMQNLKVLFEPRTRKIFIRNRRRIRLPPNPQPQRVQVVNGCTAIGVFIKTSSAPPMGTGFAFFRSIVLVPHKKATNDPFAMPL